MEFGHSRSMAWIVLVTQLFFVIAVVSSDPSVHKSLFSQNIFRGSKKIFCDFSVRKEVEKEKTETRLDALLHITCYWPSARLRWLDIGFVLFSRFYGPDFASVHKNAKRELGQYPATLNWRLVDNIYVSNLATLARRKHELNESRSPSISFRKQCCVIRSWNFQYELYLIGWANHEISFIWMTMTAYLQYRKTVMASLLSSSAYCVMQTNILYIAFYGNIYDTTKVAF